MSYEELDRFLTWHLAFSFTGQIRSMMTVRRSVISSLAKPLRLFAPDFVQESVLPKVFTPPKSWSKRGERCRNRASDPARSQGATLYAADSALSRAVHKVSQADLTHKPSRAIIAPDDPR